LSRLPDDLIARYDDETALTDAGELVYRPAGEPAEAAR
jgi:hypothetical protein